MEKSTKILIVDDHPMLREGLAVVLNAQPGLEVCGLAGSVQESLQVMEEQLADLAIIDYSLKEEVGSQVAAALVEKYPSLRILAISSISDKSNIRDMVKAGAIGFVLKDAHLTELLEAVRTTASGRTFFSREVSAILLDDLLKVANPTNAASKKNYLCKPSDLTQREMEVLQEIVAENTNKEIADNLHISVKTVENHRQNLMQKIGARNTAGLVRFALENGLIH